MTFETRLYQTALLEGERLLRSGVLDELEAIALMTTLEAIRSALFDR